MPQEESGGVRRGAAEKASPQGRKRRNDTDAKRKIRNPAKNQTDPMHCRQSAFQKRYLESLRHLRHLGHLWHLYRGGEIWRITGGPRKLVRMRLVYVVHGRVLARCKELWRRRRDRGGTDEIGLKVGLGHLDLRMHPVEASVLHLVVDERSWRWAVLVQRGLAARFITRARRVWGVGH